MNLIARLNISNSAVNHYRKQLLEYRTTRDQEIQTIDTSSNQSTTVTLPSASVHMHKPAVSPSDRVNDDIQSILAYYRDCSHVQHASCYHTHRLDEVGEELCKPRPYLWPDDEEDT